ncbi:MAG: molybdopterin molybdotransferase MoeA [Proteobacteria bacterium]|nr:molybdopterin molybdotransferase MoeA [Pseudomonadota bacterium]MBU1744704.1 molybdopterin molybdotransferase MoeA [Pseudomonadota bacterium]
MISVEEALKKILAAISPLGLEKVNILDALGRVIGEDVYAGRAIPPKDNSAMDGYALRMGDTRGASAEKPAMLEVVEEIPAGAVPEKRIGPGQAARIMTGAPVPEGADAVVRMEDTRKEDGQVAILVEAKHGQDIRLAGEDVQPGEKVISRGEVIRPAEVGMLAALGRSFVSIHQRPLVAIVATGDELTDIDEPSSPWKIINSNSYSLAALVLNCGAVPLQIGIARDRREDIVAKFRAAIRADLIVSSGGVSVGDYDLVKEVLKEEGNRMQFWRVAMKPGRPLAFGMLGEVPIVGLPGNPVSAMVSFEQFIRPTILKMMGHVNLFRQTVQARLGEDINKKPGIRHFIRARIQRDGDLYTVVTTGDQGSGILKSMVRANGLIILPEEVTTVQAGGMVTVQLLDDSLDWTLEPGY